MTALLFFWRRPIVHRKGRFLCAHTLGGVIICDSHMIFEMLRLLTNEMILSASSRVWQSVISKGWCLWEEKCVVLARSPGVVVPAVANFQRYLLVQWYLT